MSPRIQIQPLLLVLTLTLLSAGCSRPPPPKLNIDLTGAEFGRALALSDHDGRPRTLRDFAGKAVVVVFGYTTCPDICPTALARMAEVRRQLGDLAPRVQVLFVTVDPARDTADRLRAYVTWFDPSFVGLVGDDAATEATAREFRVFHAKRRTEGALGYVVDHSGGAYVLDPAGRLRLYVKDEASPASIVSDLKALLEE